MSENLFNLFALLWAVASVLFLHACLVMCEIGLVKIRYGGITNESLVLLKKRRRLAALIDSADLTGRVVRFSKTICTVGLGLLLVPLVREGFNVANFANTPDQWLLVLISFGLAVLTHFFIAEILPRGLAIKDPVRSIIRSYRVLVAFKVISFPALFFFRRFKALLFRHFGLSLNDELNPLDLDVQIRALGEDSSDLSPVARRIVDRAIQMQDLTVYDVLLPRNEVLIYDLNEDISKNLDRMKLAGHTRFPICKSGLDECLGIIHIKDIFRGFDNDSAINPLLIKRKTAVFAVETPLEEALQRMLRAKFHMALVADQFGGVLGVVTLESILEQLVGDIQDEFDSEEALIVALRTPGTYTISGSTPLHDLEARLNLRIDNDEVSTFGGLITCELGCIPKRGDQLTACGLEIKITDVDDRRVISTYVRRLKS